MNGDDGRRMDNLRAPNVGRVLFVAGRQIRRKAVESSGAAAR